MGYWSPLLGPYGLREGPDSKIRDVEYKVGEIESDVSYLEKKISEIEGRIEYLENLLHDLLAKLDSLEEKVRA
mgnify:CR=1 FL=1